MAKSKVKTFIVNIDMKWSQDLKVKAKTAAEAKRKAWDRFKKLPPRKLFDLIADKDLFSE